ncbi:MAG: LysR family transcriptional regulator [Gluconacetobacter diazotrophicus]|nr:LysR family transcriptional regulator [Gluconacetobacter diazotrophicus]
MNDLDPPLLRSFLAVADTLHFTAAGHRLGVGQSTVSQHVGRLERIVGRPLLRRNTRQVELTADGVAMVPLARGIIAAQDRALAFFEPGVLRGALRFGVSEDLVLSCLPDILRRFRAAHPRVELDLHVGLSAPLAARLEAGELDLLFAKRLGADGPGITAWREPLVWLAATGFAPMSDEPVPLVLYPDASITRRVAVEALNRDERPWRQSVASGSLAALLAALRAGFGVSAQAAFLCGSGAGTGLSALPPEHGLPPLPAVDIVVLGRPGFPLDGPAAALSRMVLDEAPVLAGHPRAPAPADGDFP